MKFSRGAIALYVGLVFVCGGVLGFYSNRLYTASTNTNPTAAKNGPNPGEFRKTLVSEYKRRLTLTDDQLLQLNLILDDTRARVEAEQKSQRERSRPELEKIRQTQIDRINGMLTPEQRVEYQKFREERRQQFQKNKANGVTGHNGPGF